MLVAVLVSQIFFFIFLTSSIPTFLTRDYYSLLLYSFCGALLRRRGSLWYTAHTAIIISFLPNKRKRGHMKLSILYVSSLGISAWAFAPAGRKKIGHATVLTVSFADEVGVTEPVSRFRPKYGILSITPPRLLIRSTSQVSLERFS